MNTFPHPSRLWLIPVIFCVALPAHAASLTLVNSSSTAPGIVTIDVMLDTAGESLNAVSGSLAFPASLLSLDSSDTSHSLVNTWIVTPHEESAGLVVWSGITPGGFSGVRSPFYQGERPGRLFQLEFSVRQPGMATLSPQELVALLNDGQGTATSVSTAPLDVLLAEVSQPSVITGTPASPADVVPADPAWAAITRSPLVADDRWYLSLDPDTNAVSVSSIEVAETSQGDPATVDPLSWHAVTDPYLLQDQSRSKYVHVRFTASSRTQYVLTLSPVHSTSRPLLYAAVAVVISLLVLVFVLLHLKIKKR